MGDAMKSADATSGSDAADEAAAAAIDPAAPLRGPAFEGADDASLGDDEWLARAIAAAAEAGLVRDARAVAEGLGEVGLEGARSETPRESARSTSAASPPSNAYGTIANERVCVSKVSKNDERDIPRVPVGWLMNQGDACLLVDNYDSYTYNLFHLIAAADATPPVVIKNDRHTWDELVPLFASGRFTRVVLSPGPGNPNTLRDVGVCRDIVDKATETPVWGVCLGHQLLAAAHGVEVRRARVPTHGVVSFVRHDGQSALFEGVPERFEQTRYHSLAVDAASLAREGAGVLRATAWTEASDARGPESDGPSDDGLFVNRWVTEEDIASARAGGEIMALEHVTRPHFGVQFHPESVCSEPHGARMYANFKAFASRYRAESLKLRWAPTRRATISDRTNRARARIATTTRFGKEGKEGKRRISSHETALDAASTRARENPRGRGDAFLERRGAGRVRRAAKKMFL
jgi:para-aminobenzoate synthetase